MAEQQINTQDRCGFPLSFRLTLPAEGITAASLKTQIEQSQGPRFDAARLRLIRKGVLQDEHLVHADQQPIVCIITQPVQTAVVPDNSHAPQQLRTVNSSLVPPPTPCLPGTNTKRQPAEPLPQRASLVLPFDELPHRIFHYIAELSGRQTELGFDGISLLFLGGSHTQYRRASMVCSTARCLVQRMRQQANKSIIRLGYNSALHALSIRCCNTAQIREAVWASVRASLEGADAEQVATLDQILFAQHPAFDYFTDTALAHAARYGSLLAVESLLDASVCKVDQKVNAYMEAFCNHNAQFQQQVAKQWSFTPLMVALRYPTANTSEIVQRLLSARASINTGSIIGQ